ncbi:MAG TPA: hypothetical protein VK527_02390 [Candidatus Limnocylindrales bacterium]|nr:hypothetical protein [Candidatus Limnocylindrales bacterium]
MIRVPMMLVFLGLLYGATAHGAPADSSGAKARVDAAALYNAGTEALTREDLGPAVAFLLAAHRIDPRARDIRTNLGIARARVEDIQGSEQPERIRPSSVLALSPFESWLLAAAIAAGGALIGWMAALRQGARRLLLAGSATFAVGALLWCLLLLRAREEARHPEAVVVSAVLDVGPSPDERPRPPFLLGAGEEVRLGRTRGDLVEVRVSGNSIGWAPRSGLWRVADAPRYTARSIVR